MESTEQTNGTDKVSDEKDVYEEQGAKPKQPASKDYQIKLFEDINFGDSQSISLKISESAVVFSDKNLAVMNIENIRYVSKYMYSENECIILSYKNVDSYSVTNVFFETEDIDGCISELKSLIESKLNSQCESKEVVVEAMELLSNQPVFIGSQKTLVQEKGNGELKVEAPAKDSPELFVIIDVECISWYDKLGPEPKYQLMFWSQETPVSIESVRLHHGKNFIMFESKTQALTMEHNYSIVNNMKLLRPKSNNFLSDFHHFHKREKLPVPTAAYRGVPKQKEDWDAETDAYAQGQGAYYQGASSTGGWEVHSLQCELDTARDQFKDKEDFSNIWITHLADLIELADTGKIPKTEISSGGLDPNNQDHFKKAVLDVSDYVKDGDMSTAMSRVQALRGTFKVSTIPEVQGFLKDLTDYDIIERLFYRGLIE